MNDKNIEKSGAMEAPVAPAVRSSNGGPCDQRQLSACWQESPLLFQEILQGDIVGHGVRQQSLKMGVLLLKGLQTPRLGNIHSAKFGLPRVDAGVADAVFTAKVSLRKASPVLLQDGYDLLFGKPATLHVLVLQLGQNELQTGLNCGGKVSRSE